MFIGQISIKKKLSRYDETGQTGIMGGQNIGDKIL